jgi:uncharacterized protein
MSDNERHLRLWPAVLASLPAAGGLAHDAQHIERVRRWAVRLADEAGADPDLAGAAGLLHDLVQIPKESPQRDQGAERSALAAAAPLREVGYDTAQAAAVVEAIRTCSWSRGLAPTTPLGAVLQDADRLDALGVIGFARTMATAEEMARRSGRSGAFAHPDDPLGLSGRALDDRCWALDHIDIKLRHLVTGLHTASARREGARRLATLLALRAAWAEESA